MGWGRGVVIVVIVPATWNQPEKKQGDEDEHNRVKDQEYPEK